MLGILVQLALSLCIIWFFEKRTLSVLGWLPIKERVLDFLLFFSLTTLFCATGFLLKMYFGEQRWYLNPDLSASLVLKGVWWNIKSVLFEELIFRGVILYILIKRIGARPALIISAAGFGIYHWFSFGVIGQAFQMIVAFITTGLMGVLLAYGYAKTFSLYIPVAIHLGWNLTQIFIFSQGPIGNGILVQEDNTSFRTNSYLLFFVITFLPMICMLVINFLIISKKKISRNIVKAGTFGSKPQRDQ